MLHHTGNIWDNETAPSMGTVCPGNKGNVVDLNEKRKDFF